MKEVVLTFGGIFGTLAVIFGAFGAHALKKKLSEDQLKSFETGVKYQMYHAIILIIIGIIFPFIELYQIIMAWCFLLGNLLFSFSIFGLVLSTASGKKLTFLGPVTPIGGLLLVIGWVLLTYNLSRWALYL
ncbi:MAG TPA: DUF423 domain-containing protein [Gillisia sp.]|nr:DUF423 domain-containing protein [Gillisia sp.]